MLAILKMHQPHGFGNMTTNQLKAAIRRHLLGRTTQPSETQTIAPAINGRALVVAAWPLSTALALGAVHPGGTERQVDPRWRSPGLLLLS